MVYFYIFIVGIIIAVLYWCGDIPANDIYGGYIDDSQNFYIWDE